mgnify:CR=1 FL=1
MEAIDRASPLQIRVRAAESPIQGMNWPCNQKGRACQIPLNGNATSCCAKPQLNRIFSNTQTKQRRRINNPTRPWPHRSGENASTQLYAGAEISSAMPKSKRRLLVEQAPSHTFQQRAMASYHHEPRIRTCKVETQWTNRRVPQDRRTDR